MTRSDQTPHRFETRSAKFVRIAEKRVHGIIRSIEVLQQLANKNNYDYTDEQRIRIFRAIKSAVSEADNAFKGVVKERKRFKL